MAKSARAGKSTKKSRKKTQGLPERLDLGLTLSYRALEARMVFDAALAATAADATDRSAQTDSTADTAGDTPPDAHSEQHSTVPFAPDAEDLAVALGAASQGTTIVFIDGNLPDMAAILAGVPPGAEVITLTDGQGALAQMVTALAGRTDIAGIHIISHGSSGELNLAGETLTIADLNAHAAELGAIGAALSSDGDILIYGCGIAAGTKGQAFVEALASLTGADVGASTDDTGSAALGGDWDLEASAGTIQVIAIQAVNWEHLLSPITVVNVNGTTTTATTLANNIAGAGITVISATYSGDNSQAGTFTSATGYPSEWLGYDTGVIFSTGTTSVAGANTAGNTSTNAPGAGNDADFTTIGGGTSNDSSYLSVTFVPTSSKVTLQFTLGSEEYNEYVYANFNDAIGVWVNGTHISVTPTGEAVAIDTINQAGTYTPANGVLANDANPTNGVFDSANASLFINNAPGAGTYNVIMDGFTVTLTLVANVNIGVNNTIKLGVADIGDAAYDSWMFVRENSLECVTIANTDYATTLVNTPVTIDVAANDTTTSGPLTITKVSDKSITAGGAAVTLATGATVQLTLAGQLLYTPASGQTGVETFTYTVADTGGSTAVGFVSINIGVNVAPVIDLNDNGTTAARDNSVSYSEGGAAVAVTTATASVIDSNDTSFPSLGITLGGFQSTGNEVVTIGGTAFTYGTAQTSIIDMGATSFSIVYDGGIGFTIANAAPDSEIPDAKLEALIRTITYQHTGDSVTGGNRTLSFVTNDGYLSSNVAVSTIAVTAVNDAPVNTLPASFTAGSMAPVTLSGLSVSDADAFSGTITTTLSVTAGTLAAVAGGGVTVSGSGTSSLTLTGTVANLNAFLTSSAPTFSSSTVGTVTLTMLTNDGGNTGTGGALTDSDNSTITVIAAPIVDLNSGPTVTTTGPSSSSATSTSNLVTTGTFGTTAGAPPAPWTETDPNGVGSVVLATGNGRYDWTDSAGTPTLTQALTIPASTSNTTITTTSTATSTTVTSTTVTTSDALTSITFDFYWQNNNNSTSNLTVAYGGTTYATITTGAAGGNATITPGGGASAVLGGTITSQNEATATTPGTVTITFASGLTSNGNLVFTYGGGASDDLAIDNVVATATKTTTTTVNSVDTTTADTTDNNWTATYTENGSPVSIADTDSSIFDGSDTNMESVTITLTNPATGDRLLVNGSSAASGTLASGISWTRTDTSVVLSGSFTKAQYADAIELVQFENTTEIPSTTPRTIHVIANDGDANSNTAVATINVTLVNDAPGAVITPASYAATEQVALTLKGTGLSISDVDAASGSMTVTLSVGEGALTATAGDSGTSVSGSGTSSLTITGTVAQVNAFLGAAGTSTLSYTNSLDAPSASTVLTLAVNDNGNTGGGALTGSDTATINITPVNDAPGAVITPASYAATEQVALTLKGTGLSISDVDAASGSMTVTLSVGEGALTATAGDSGTSVSGSGTSSLTITGTVAQVNAFLGAAGTSTLSYTNSLDAPSASTVLTLAVNDNGNTGGGALTGSDTATINITPVNDAPDAIDDAASVLENGTLASDVTPGTLGQDSDVDGDTLTVDRINGATFTAGNPVTLPSGAIVTMLANGTFNYNPNGQFEHLGSTESTTDSFTYRIADGNGGFDTATVVVTINGQDDPLVFANLTDGAGGSDGSVAESDLATGSTPAGTGEATSGTFAIAAPDGLASLTVGGTTISAAALAASGTTNIAVATAHGTLVITGYTAATGAVGYTFTLTSAADHAGGGVNETIGLVLTDADGDTAPATLALVLVDDAPSAADDSNTLTEDAVVPATGNVVTASDTIGADATATPVSGVVAGAGTPLAGNVGVALAGLYGTLTLNADGSYSYTVDTANPAVNGLQAGDPALNDVFTYQLSDADGDGVTATLTVAVTGLNDAPVADDEVNTVPEDTPLVVGAAGGLLAGDTDADGDPLSLTTFTVAGDATVYAAGSAAAMAGVGSLTLNADGSYTFTPAPDYNGPVPVATYTVSDGTTTDTGTLTLSVTPVADAPAITGLTDGAGGSDGSVAESDLATGSTPAGTGEATSGTFAIAAPDGLASLTVGGTTISAAALAASGTTNIAVATAHGTLVITGYTAATGAVGYTFTLTSAADHAGGGVNETIGLVLTDADGDTAPATLALVLVDDAPSAADDSNTLTEDAVVPATGNVVTASDTIGADATATPVSGVVAGAGTPLAGNVGVALAGLYGTLTLNADGSYSYTVDTANPAVNGLQAGDPALNDVFTYQLSDADGDGVTATLTVAVTGLNDAPVADDEVNTVPEDTPLVVGAAGGLLAGDTDADGDPLSLTTFTVAGDATVYAAGSAAAMAGVGSLTLNADGSYTFTPAPDYNGPVPVATYTVSDGTTTDTGTLTLSVTPVADAPAITGLTDGAGGSDGSVAESDLATGSTPAGTGEATSGTFAIAAPDGLASLTVGGTTISAAALAASGTTNIAVATAHGTLVITGYTAATGAVGYTFTLTSAADHAGGGVNETIGLVLTDADGDTAPATLALVLVDDAPSAADDSNTLTEDAVVPATGNVVTASDTIGADATATPVSGVVAGAGTPLAGNVGVALAGLYGTLTLNADGSYSYTVDTANPAVNGLQAGDPALNDVFTYQLSDADGDGVTATLTVAVTGLNDAPVADDEVNTVPEDTPLVVGAAGGLLAGDTDADGDPLSLTTFTVAGDATVYAAGSAAAMAGVGSLTLNADGSYTFTPAPDYNGPVPVATYTVSDGTTTDTGTLTLSVTPVADAPAITGLTDGAGGSDGSVAESDLATGSTPAGTGEATSGTFAIAAPDGLASLTVGGTTISAAALAASGTTNIAVATAHGTLVITGYTAATGAVGYTFTLTSAADHAGGGVNETIGLVLTDADGDTAPATLALVLVDDAPSAADDSNTLTEDAVVPATGNVVTASDTIGADATATPVSGVVAGAGTPLAGNVGVALAGLYGTLTLNADGSYSYTVDTANPAVNGLQAGDPALNDVFTYQLSDADGDGVTATLTVAVTGLNDAPVADDEVNTVPEDTPLVVGAAGGLLAGDTDADGDPLSLTTFTVAGDATVYAAGSAAAMAGVGSLTLNADGSYTFTPAPDYNGPVPVATYTVSDGTTTDTGTLTLSVTPVADAPAITGLTDGAGGSDGSVAESDLATGSTPAGTGEATSGTFAIAAPDGLASLTVGGTTISAAALAASGTTNIAVATAHGTLVITGYTAATGAVGYTFTLTSAADHAGGGVNETIGLVLTDADGDTAPATLALVLVDDAPSAADDSNTLTEDAVVPATGNVVTASDTIGADATATPVSGVVAGAGTPLAGNVGVALAGLYGTLTLNADGSYSYTVDTANPAVNGLQAGDPALNDVFTYQLSDADGDGVTATLTVAVTGLNDAPVADDEVNTVPEDTPLVVGAAGGLLAGDTDADGDPLSLTTFTVAGDATVYAAGSAAAMAGVGSLTLNADGSYTFTPAPDYNGPVPVATYTVSDGTTTDTGTLTLSVTPVADAPAITGLTDGAGGSDGSVAESDLATGSTPAGTGEATSGTFAIAAPDGLASLTVGGTTISAAALAASGTTNIAVATAHGTLVITGYTAATGAVGYTFTLTSAADHAGGGVNETIGLVLTDADGDTAPATLALVLVDDAPSAADDSNTLTEDAVVPATGNVVTASDTIGADATATPVSGVVAGAGTPLAGNVGVALAGLYGTLTLNADGSYSYTVDTANPAVNGLQAGDPALNDVFTYQLSDADGDGVTATLTVAVTGLNDAPVADDEVNTVPEDTPLVVGAAGGLLAGDTDADGDPLSLTTFTVAGDATVYAAGSAAAMAGVGSLTLNADGSYTFTPAPDYNGPVPVATYTVSDGTTTDTGTLTLSVTPVADAPAITGLTDGAGGSDGSVAESDLATGSTPAGTGEATSGTFAIAAPDGLASLTVGGTTISAAALAASGTTNIAVATAHGTLVITGYTAATGAVGYTFTLTSAADHAGGGVNETIGLVLTDADGDTAPATLALVLVDDAPSAADDSNTLTEDAVVPATGNVVTASDTIGADATATPVSGVVAGAGTPLAGNVGVALAGLYGTLTLNADGSYSYTVDTANPAVNGLQAGDPALNDVFTYQLSDADGDGVTATLTVAVTGLNDAPVADDEVNTVPEDTPLVVGAAGGLLAGDTDADGDPLSLTTFTVAGDATVYAAGSAAAMAGVGSLTLNADGSYTFTPAPDYNGPVPVATYTVSDGTTTDTGTLTLSVTPVADAPAITGLTDGAGGSDGSVAESDLATGSTPAGTGEATSGTFAIAAPDGLASLTVGGTTISAAALAASGTTNIAVATAHGTLVITGYTAATGAVGYTFTLTSAADHAGGGVNETIGLVLTDADGDTAPATLALVLVDDAPSAADDSNTLTEDAVVPATGNVVTASDTIGADATATPVSGVVAGAGTPLAGNVGVALAGLYGTLTLNADGSYSYTVDTANPAVNGLQAGDPALNDVFTYQLSDADGDGVTATLTVAVTGLNDAPVADDEVNTVPEDTPLVVGAAGGLLAGDTDADGDPLSLTTFTVAGDATVYAAGSAAAMAGVGSLTLNADGSYTFTPAPDYNGPVPVATYTVSDGTTTDTGTLTLSVTPVADAPAITGLTDGAGGSDGSVAESDLATGSTPAGTGEATSGTFAIAAPDGLASLTVGGTTISAAALAASGTTNIAVATAHGTLVITGYTAATGAVGYTFTLTSAADHAGGGVNETIGLVLTDADGDTAPATLALVLVDDAPSAADDSNTLTEDAVVPATGNVVTASDTIGADATATPVSGVVAGAGTPLAGNVGVALAGLYGTLTLNADGSYSYTVDTANPAVNGLQAGDPALNDVFTYQLSDADGDGVTATLTVAVTGLNDAPVADDEVNTVPEDTPLVVGAAGGLLAGDTDADGDPLSLTTFTVAGDATVYAAGSAAAMAGVGSLTLNADGSYTFTPAPDYNGPVPVATYTVSDGTTTDTGTLTLSVTPVADAPAITGLTDGAGGSDGSVAESDLATGSTPAGTGEATSGTFAIAAPDGLASLTVGGTTISAAALAASGTTNIAVATAHGTLVITGYTAATGAVGYTFTLTSAADHAGGGVNETIGLVLTDADGDTAPATLALVLVDDAPSAADDSNTLTEDAVVPATGNVVTASDTIGADATATPVSGVVAGAGTPLAGNVGVALAGLYGTLTLNADGSYSYTVDTANPAVNGLQAGDPALNDVFTYQLSDADGDGVTATLTVAVTGLNDAPVADDEVNTVPEDTPLVVGAAGGLLAGDTDADGDPLSLTTFTVAGDATVYAAGSAAAMAGVGSLTLNADGSYTFTPAPDYNGPVPVATYTVSDGTTTDTGTLTLSVTPVADAPAITGLTDGAGGSDGSVAESDLATGSTPAGTGEATSGTFAIAAPDGLASLTVGGTTISAAALAASGTTNIAVATAHGTLVITGYTAATGAVGYTFTLTSAADHAGGGVNETIGLVLTDADGDTAPATLALVLVDDAPSAADDSNTLTEDAVVPATGNVVTASDTIGADATATPVSGVVAGAGTPLAGNVGVALAGLYGTLTLNADGSYSYTVDTANPAVNGLQAGDPALNDVFTYQLSDADGDGVTATLTVAVTGLNDAPVADDEVNTVPEDTPLVVGAAGGLLAGDTDADGDPLSLTTFTVAGDATVYAAGSAAAMAGVGSLTLNADGSYTFTPAPDYNGPVPVATYTVSDGTTTDTGTLTLSVTPVNDPPVIIDPLNPGTPANPIPATDPLNIIPDVATSDGSPLAPIDVSNFVVDPEGDTLTYALDPGTTPSWLSINPTTGQITGTPPANASGLTNTGNPGEYLLTITASDGNGGIATTTVTLNIVNLAPVAVGDSASVSENAASVIGNVITDPLTGDSDTAPDSDPLHVASAVQGVNAITIGVPFTTAGGGMLTLNANGSYTFVPGAAYNGLTVGETATETIGYTVSDGNGGTATAQLVITINGANDVPVVIDPSNPGTPENPIPAGDPLNIIPDVSTTDGTPLPTINVGDYVVDPDGDSLIFALDPLTTPSWLSINPATGEITGTPPANASVLPNTGNAGEYLLTITADDSNGGIATTTVTLNILNAPPAPVNDTNTVLEGGPGVPGNVLSNDQDGALDTDPLTVTAVNGSTLAVGSQIILPSGALLTLNANGSYDYDHNGAFDGISVGDTATDSFTYQVSDGQGGFSTATVTITILGENDAPEVVDPLNPGVPPIDPNNVVPLVSGRDGTPVTLNVSSYFKDPDVNDVLTFSVNPGSLPPGLTFNPVTGTFSGTPSSDASQGGPLGDGIYKVLVTAADGHGGTVATTITFEFTNPPPVAGHDFVRTSPDTPVTINVLANDRDGGSDRDPLTLVSATATGGTVTMNSNGTLTFVPASGYAGLASITYVVTDGQGGFATATASILITISTHATGTTDYDVPMGEPLVSSPLGISTDGIVLTTVNDVNSLGSISASLTENGIIDAVANQISSLGSIGGLRDGVAASRLDVDDLHRLWWIEHQLDNSSGRGNSAWDPQSLTGFSLRFIFAGDLASGHHADIVLESLVHERTLIIRMSSTEIPEHAQVVEYRVMQADGRALPGWLNRAGPELLIGERPANIEKLELRVIAVLSNGTTIERDVVIQTNSGEIQPLATGKRADIVPLFSDQLQAHADARQSELEDLALALAG